MRLTILGLALMLAGVSSAHSQNQTQEVCGSCDKQVLVSGNFYHHNARGRLVVQGAPEGAGEAYVDGIYGSNFIVSVPNLPPGKYTATFGFIESDMKKPGERLFDIHCGDQTVAADFDIVGKAGGEGKVCYLGYSLEHPGDARGGPVTFVFTAHKDLAKLNTFELKNAADQSLVFLKVMDLIGAEDPDALKQPEQTMPVIWTDPAAGLMERVGDLVSRMSLAEKVAQLQNGAPAIPRLGLPAYNYWNECLHGVARNGYATVFPQAIGMAAAWDPALLHQVADVIATEARAKNNDYTKTHHGDAARYFGLTFWTPNINIFRDPRWGRGQETYGEDPFLTAQMGVAFIRGLQGDDPKYIKALACAKHFAVHSGPEPLRHSFDARPSARDLYETYLPAFEAAVREGHVGAVMGAYNSLDGEPACSSKFLLDDLLRKQWGFQGHVVSDCAAIYDIFANHKVVPTAEAAAARAVQAGCDLCCSTDYNSLVRAVKEKLITEPEIDTALKRVLEARFRLGLFDPPAQVPYRQITLAENDTPEHEQLAWRMAGQSIVLLKNDGLLPLDRNRLKRIAVIGANANSVEVLLGNYYGTPSRPVTVLDGIKAVAGPGVEIVYEPGCPLALRRDGTDPPAPEMAARALAAARSADIIVYVGGLSLRLEDEEMRVDYDGFDGGDRTRIELPAPQTELLKSLQATGKPVVFVNCSGSAIAMPWEAGNLPAIIQAWYPGEQGGRAVADVLFGNVNPAARLPVTFYRSTADLPPFEDYAMSNRTYRYFSGKPLFAFGHGLSYTRFEYRDAALNTVKTTANQTLQLHLNVANTGPRDGDEVVQVYFRHVKSPVPQPRLALCAFRRVPVAHGQTASVTLDVPVERFRSWDEVNNKYTVEPGDYELLVGAASDDIRARLPLSVNP